MSTLQTTLTACTCNIANYAVLTQGQAYPITITANTGYYFATIPTCTSSILDITPNADVTEYTGTITLNYSMCRLTAKAVAQPTPSYHFNVDNVTNATTNVDSTTDYNLGDEVTVTITANEGYYFSTPPRLSYVNSVGSYVDEPLETTDMEQYSIDFVIPNCQLYVIFVNAVAQVIPNDNTSYHFNVDNVTNATTNVDSTTDYNLGDEVTVTITANEGYYFSTPPRLGYLSSVGSYVDEPLETTDTGQYKQNYSIDFVIPDCQLYTINVNAVAQVIPNVDKYGIITIYNPTPQELKAIGDVRYMNDADDVDLGDYISNLIKIYVEIPQLQTATVLLGGYTTGVTSNVVIDDVVETDCGTVELVGNYNNAMDFENTEVEIYLPLIGFQTLETKKVMNETLHLLYRTNVINGDTIACIYNLTGTLLYTFNSNASFEIPYRLNAEKQTQGQLEVNSNYLFGFTPFITMRYNKAVNTTSIVANDDRSTKLINESGFVRCSEVFNTIYATTSEKEEIETLLKGGVIV